MRYILYYVYIVLHETFGNFISTITSCIFTANIQDVPAEGGHLNI